MLIPVLAAGVVGACLGATVTHLRRSTLPMIPVRLARQIIDFLREDRDLAHADAVAAQSAAGIMVEQRDEALLIIRALVTEAESLVSELDAMRAGAELAEAASSWMRRPTLGSLAPIREGSAVMLNPPRTVS